MNDSLAPCHPAVTTTLQRIVGGCEGRNFLLLLGRRRKLPHPMDIGYPQAVRRTREQRLWMP